MREFDWLIIGGGPHGVHAAARLVGEVGLDPARVCILDPAARLLARWKRWTAQIGMRHLRSPAVHHLDLAPFDLRQLPDGIGQGIRTPFARPYGRPDRQLFERHCDRVIQRFGLAACHWSTTATALRVAAEQITVETAAGPARARQVVLALGPPPLHRPAWAPPTLPRDRVIHALEPGLDPAALAARGGPVAVVGGGLTAAQIALALEEAGAAVTLIRRHPWRVHTFDSDPGWIGPKYMAAFERERDWCRRRDLIQQARHRGSVPEGVLRRLRARAQDGGLRLVRGDIYDLSLDARGICLAGLAEAGPFAAVILATGFTPVRPGGALVDGLVSQGLPTAPCGFPVPDAQLRWHPRLQVMGGLAELRLGPTARNLTGARRAGEQIAAVARGPAGAAR